ncbi:MAG: hypothetical protein FWE45_01625 [Firmicutes bacterium]|nr:hypothetical protein [Bacillota bacterium]
MSNIQISDFSECDILAFSTLTAKQFAQSIKDSDTLSFWGDFFTALGDNLTMLAGQRERIENRKQAEKEKCKAKTDSTTNPENTDKEKTQIPQSNKEQPNKTKDAANNSQTD